MANRWHDMSVHEIEQAPTQPLGVSMTRFVNSLFIFVAFALTTAGPIHAEPPCPKGYRVFSSNGSVLVCKSEVDVKTICPSHTNVYACGLDAARCCDMEDNNPCMKDFNSCKRDYVGTAARFCCRGGT